MVRRVYAAKAKNAEVLSNSSSGGMFTLLSDEILNNGGAVVAAVYNYSSHIMEFRLITKVEMRDKARGSKYMQASMRDILKDSYAWIKVNPDKPLLFIGLGCQSDSFRAYIKQKGCCDKDIYCVDIICHGTPSPQLWSDYAAYITSKCGIIHKINFKDKRYGWRNNLPIAETESCEIEMKEYKKLFYDRVALRPSCHMCPYASIKRNTDITIGDFWGIENSHPTFNDEGGCSLCIIHTEKGNKLFESIKNNCFYIESDEEKCLQPNLIQPTEVAENREQFWHDYVEKGFRYILKKYGRISIMKKVINKIGGGVRGSK